MKAFRGNVVHRFILDNAGLLAVILITVIFISVRLAMPIKFDGSYIDEFFHIINGISLLESSHCAYFYNDGEPYSRGPIMSLWVGLWLTLLGKSMLVAKLAPATIGVTNYFVYLYLSTKLIDKKRFQILSLLLFTISPWCIFNHFYIRMYVVYESFLLIILLLGYKLYTAIKDGNGRSVALFLVLITIINIINLFENDDDGKYMVLVASSVLIASLFILEFNTDLLKLWGLTIPRASTIFLSTRKYRALLVIIVAILAFILLDGFDRVEFLMTAKLQYTSADGYKYPWLFFGKNGVITTFFALAVATFWVKNNGFEKIILPISGILFLIHFLSSEDLQITRGVLYFMPLFYLTAVIGASKVMYSLKWLWYFVISSMFLICTVNNVTRDYYWTPCIAHEISYIEYARLYEAVRKNCHGSLIIEAAHGSPQIARFHGVNVDFVLSASGYANENSQYTFDTDTETYKTVWGLLPVITNINDLQTLNRDICLIVRRPSKERFIPSTFNKILQGADKSWQFHNIALYKFTPDTLRGCLKSSEK